jgi:hypothetical protein
MVRDRSVGLAVEEERDAQEEAFKRFTHDYLGASSDRPKASTSEDEGELPPGIDEGSAVKAFAGNGFQVVQDQEEVFPTPPAWSGHARTMAEQIRQQQQEATMLAAIPTWISMADRLVIGIESSQSLPWDIYGGPTR